MPSDSTAIDQPEITVEESGAEHTLIEVIADEGSQLPVGHAVFVNDYAGHPFQIDLSNEFASQGAAVTHVYCRTNVTPRGQLDESEHGPEVVAISTGDGFEKYDIKRRLLGEVKYGAKSVRLLWDRRPHACLNANVPVVSLAMMTLAAKLLRVRNVLWLQDLQGGLVAMAVGEDHLAAKVAKRLERWCTRAADHVVTISSGFQSEVVDMGVPSERVTTIPNWAPIDEVPVLAKSNSWSVQHGLDDRLVFLYSGSLGIKHRPEALVELAKRLEVSEPDAVVLLVSESVGVDWIEEQRSDDQPLDNLRVLPFQPFELLPEVLATADVVVALLEPDAGEFSVPSKVLTYLCAGRPVLGLMPAVNAASTLIANEASAGLTSEDLDGFLENGLALAVSPEVRERLGMSGRNYAERHFKIANIGQGFARVLTDNSGRPKASRLEVEGAHR